ncbi:uncharacterized protein [Watersipora subatra]|uniref:uncharacterized protein n=1 Tax=Watersipora subatra TaxID=2589382 RepID=UPI00355BDBAF
MALLRGSTNERMSEIAPAAIDHWLSLKDQHYLTQERKEVIKAFYASLKIPTLDIGFTIRKILSALSIQWEEGCKLLPQAKVIKSFIRNLPPSHEEKVLKAFLYLHLTLRIKLHRLYTITNKEKFGPYCTIVANECGIYVTKQQPGKYHSCSELTAAQLMLHHLGSPWQPFISSSLLSFISAGLI